MAPTPRPSRPVADDLWLHEVAPMLAAGAEAVTGAALRAAGATSADVRGWVRAGRLVRLRRNLLVEGEVWRAAAPWERHVLRARAYAHELDGRAVLSHHSALAVMGLDVFGVDDQVHACVREGRGRRTTGLVLHRPVPEERITDAFGLPTVDVATACAQVAGEFGLEAGAVAADSALRRGRCTSEELAASASWPWLGTSRPVAELAARLATPLHESPGETRCFLLLRRLGHADVRPQVRITDARGVVVARVDFLLGDRVVVEFDGDLKYADRRDLVAEKRREDLLRSLGYEVVRVTWRDLDEPDVVRERIEAALRRAASRGR